ncbi:glycosyltransferase [Hymenobacter sp. B1770]|uniref:glycosyltransferase n=1 Tax=Hymenobacter sp. B1770 TaxID=1718788 RepID=UPI003CEDFE13
MTEMTTASKSPSFTQPPSALPLVSLGVASYNNARYIYETLDSIYLLCYANKELIIVDDASTDNSVEVIESWIAAHPGFPARLVRHLSNRGLCQVCNQLVSEARGEFIAMIGSDDLYKPHMVTEAVAEMQRRGAKCGAVYADCEMIDKAGAVLAPSFLEHFDSRFGPDYPTGNIRIPLLRGFYLPAATVLIRRSVLLQVGPYDDRLLAEDLDMWLRLCLHSEFAFVPMVVSAYRVHGLSITQSNKPGLNETFFHIYKKTQFSSGPEIEAAQHMLADHAEHYYCSKGTAAAPMLWYTFRETKSPKMFAFWLLARSGVTYATLRRLVRR